MKKANSSVVENECEATNFAPSTNAAQTSPGNRHPHDSAEGPLLLLEINSENGSFKNDEVDLKTPGPPKGVKKQVDGIEAVDLTQLKNQSGWMDNKENSMSFNALLETGISKGGASFSGNRKTGLPRPKYRQGDHNAKPVPNSRTQQVARFSRANLDHLLPSHQTEVASVESSISDKSTFRDTSGRLQADETHLVNSLHTCNPSPTIAEPAFPRKSQVSQAIPVDSGIDQHSEISGEDLFDDTLAVAIAVTGDEEDDTIPAAFKYDPEKTIPTRKRCRNRLRFIVITVVMVSIALSITFGVIKSKDNQKTEIPTTSPTTAREGEGILYKLIEIVGEATLRDPNSAHSLAADWIISKDPLELNVVAINLAQRFLIVLFYISTAKNKNWRSCNPPLSHENDYCIIDSIISAVNVDQHKVGMSAARWLSAKHECQWAGITCDEFQQIRAIDLSGQEIRGTIPKEISLLPFLQSLALPVNELYGTLPEELGSMKFLINIELQYNFFTGHVPTAWYKLFGIQSINLGANFITGTISSELGLLSSLKGWFVQENTIEGTIPTDFGLLQQIAFSRWSRNFLSGKIPSEFGNLRGLKELWLANNGLTGTMPSEMGKMNSIHDLRLNGNDITGTVPEEHFNMTDLRRWDLHAMNLSATISTNISRMTSLQDFLISANKIYGVIPSEMGLLTRLKEVWLQQNHLTGTVPLELCSLRGTDGLETLNVDCAPTFGGGGPLVECSLSCCTSCCDATTGFCVSNPQ